MAGASVGIEVKYEDRGVRQALRRLERAGGDMRTAFQAIGDYLDLSTRERFDNERGPDGRPWEPLADSTLRRGMLGGVRRGKGEKRRRLTTKAGNTKAGAVRKLAGKKILVESGALRDTLRYRATATSLEFGTDREYGATHQFGDEERNIPARPYLGINSQDEAEILAILQHHLKQALGD